MSLSPSELTRLAQVVGDGYKELKTLKKPPQNLIADMRWAVDLLRPFVPKLEIPTNGKQPYKLPMMADILGVPPTWTMVSTFSGTGGDCLGYRWAGAKVLFANEFVKAAQKSYKANYPDTPLDGRDIRQVRVEDVRKTIGDIELDVLAGSPPCVAFSIAGKTSEVWNTQKRYSGKTQRVDDLFYEYVRLLKGLKPRMFVAENVEGLTKGDSKGVFVEILKALQEAGYRVKAALLNADRLYVPQDRPRVFFIGIRNDLPGEIRFPKPLPYTYSIIDALSYLEDYRKAGSFGTYPRLVVRAQKFGGKKASEALKAAKRTFRDIDLPSPTFTVHSIGGVGFGYQLELAPGNKRQFTIDECKTLCGFPADFQLVGKYATQFERLGRAVPPPMAYHVGLMIREMLDATRQK